MKIRKTKLLTNKSITSLKNPSAYIHNALFNLESAGNNDALYAKLKCDTALLSVHVPFGGGGAGGTIVDRQMKGING